MIQKYVSSLEIKKLEEQAHKFVHESMMEFIRQQSVLGNVRQEKYSIKEFKYLLNEQKELEIPNMLANYVTLKDFIKDATIHLLEEPLMKDDHLEIRRYTTTNLPITIIFEVKRVTWDRYPEIRFAECNIKIINKPYEQVKLEEVLQSLLEMKKAELGTLINTEEIYFEMLQGDIEIEDKEVEDEFIINLDKLNDAIRNRDRYSERELEQSMKILVEVYLKSSQHKVKEKTSINKEVIQLLDVIKQLENIVQTEKVSDIMTFLKFIHV